MDATHLHLMLTHFPIVGTIIGIGVLAYGQFINNNSIKKLALAIFIVMSILTIPVFLTGEGAEETVEHLEKALALDPEFKTAKENLELIKSRMQEDKDK